jgi:hypothetical protein
VQGRAQPIVLVAQQRERQPRVRAELLELSGRCVLTPRTTAPPSVNSAARSR